MKTNSTSLSAFFAVRVELGFFLCAAGIMLAVAALSTSVSGKTSIVGRSNPVPLVNQPLVPDAVVPGGADFTLTVNGTGFVPDSVVNWNGSARATVFLSNSQLTATILASDIATASTASITVVNPGPGGGMSNVAFFLVTIPTSSVSFGTSDYATGISPNWVAVGDFNADSRLDLAVVNNGSNTVSVLLGNGDGTFQAHVDSGTGPGPFALAIGDFNRDGKLDLAVTNGTFSVGNTVSVLLGNGDGTFQAHVDYGTRLGPVSLAVGDFNRDGNLDLAVACYGPAFQAGQASILLGNGDGTFRAHLDSAAGVNPVSIVLGDFNADGDLDLAVGDNNYPQGESVLLGNGDGTFRPPVLYQLPGGPHGTAVGDFNADAKLDLAPGQYGKNLAILLGSGDGTFQPPVYYPVGDAVESVVVGDLNADGKLDLVTANNFSNDASILLGNGDGTFQRNVDYRAGSNPVEAAVGDFNADGRLDMVTANAGDNTVSVLLQTLAVDQNCLPAPAGLVSWWSGDRTVDDMQGKNPGELVGGASYKPGMVGPGFVFHGGLNEYVQVGDTPTLKMTTAMTLECWIYPTDHENRIIANREGEYEVFLSVGDGAIGWAFANTNPGWVGISTGFVPPLASWTHVAITYDNGLITTYADGVQVHQYQGSGVIGDVLPTLNDFRVGNRQQFPQPFDGRIDEVKVYNRTLSSSEITAIYAAGPSGNCKPEIFVSSIDPSYKVSQYLVTTSVAIDDTNGIPIADATANVKVAFPSGSEPVFPAQTDKNGVATFSFYTSETGLYRFKIIKVGHPARDYNPSLNIESFDKLTIP